jgi:hypothetical protein
MLIVTGFGASDGDAGAEPAGVTAGVLALGAAVPPPPVHAESAVTATTNIAARFR